MSLTIPNFAPVPVVQDEYELGHDYDELTWPFTYRAFADFVFGSLILHFFCVNFIN